MIVNACARKWDNTPIHTRRCRLISKILHGGSVNLPLEHVVVGFAHAFIVALRFYLRSYKIIPIIHLRILRFYLLHKSEIWISLLQTVVNLTNRVLKCTINWILCLIITVIQCTWLRDDHRLCPLMCSISCANGIRLFLPLPKINTLRLRQSIEISMRHISSAAFCTHFINIINLFE